MGIEKKINSPNFLPPNLFTNIICKNCEKPATNLARFIKLQPEKGKYCWDCRKLFDKIKIWPWKNKGLKGPILHPSGKRRRHATEAARQIEKERRDRRKLIRNAAKQLKENLSKPQAERFFETLRTKRAEQLKGEKKNA